MTDALVVAGPLVRYLRLGLRRELSASLAVLAVIIDTTHDSEAYRAALARFDEARALLDVVGLQDETDPREIQIDLLQSPRLVLRALESQYMIEMVRLEETAVDGIGLPAPDVLGLEGLITEVRRRTGLSPASRRFVFLEPLLEGS